MDEKDEKKVGDAAQVGPAIDAQLELVKSLATENDSLLERLRGTQIPQHVGIAAAGRALAADVPRALMAQVQADLTSGALGKRWEGALARAGGEDGAESSLAALATLLIEHARATGRYLSARGEEWAADAYRLEGQATAVEAQVQRLTRAQEGIAHARAGAEAQTAVQERRRAQRENGEAPSLRAVPVEAAESSEV